MLAAQAHDAVITLDWDSVSKRWKMVYRCRSGLGWATHWRWIETSAPIDAWVMRRLANSIKAEMESYLF